MIRLITIILLTLSSSVSHATLNEIDKTQIYSKNLLKNGGFESGKALWTASGGTFAVTTTSPMIGLAHATFDSNGASQTLTSTATAIPVGMYGRNGVISCLITTASGTSTHTIQAYDGSNILVSATITSNTNPTRTTSNFIFPTSGNISLRLVSVAADEPSIAIDDCYVGPAEGFNFALGQGQDVFSAYSSSAGVVSKENADWINGNCVVTGTSVYTCAVNSGVFSTTPNCNATLDRTSVSNAHVSFDPTNSSATSLIFRTNDATPTASAIAFNFVCQKAGVDAPAQAFKPSTIASSWSGYFDNTCSFARTNTAYGDATDASCNLTTRVSVNFGSVTSNAGTNIGVVFIPKRAGTFRVCANASVLGATSGADLALKLWDGTTTIAERDLDAANTSNQHSVEICGNYTAASTSPVTLSIQTKSSTGAITIQALTGASAVEWSIFQIDQQLPAPLLVNSVVNPSSGVTKVVTAFIANSGTPTVTSQDGSWISSLTDTGTGDTTINISAGTFSSTPRCFCTAYATGARICRIDETTAISTSVVRVGISSVTPSAIDEDFFIMCVGAN